MSSRQTRIHYGTGRKDRSGLGLGSHHFNGIKEQKEAEMPCNRTGCLRVGSLNLRNLQEKLTMCVAAV